MNKLTFAMTMLCAISAWGQAEEKKAAAPPHEMKPPAELEQYKGMIGNWKCQGQGTMMGQAMKTSATYKASWDLDKYWVVGKFEGKAAGMPGSQKGRDFYGYDTGKKMFVNMSFDNMGGYSTAWSTGWQGDKQEWSGKGSMMGKEADMKWIVTRKGDKEISLAGSMGTDTWEATCKK